MFRSIKLARMLVGGKRFVRGVVLALTFITMICIFLAAPMLFIGQSRHAAWQGSGIENVDFFTKNFRFDFGYTSIDDAFITPSYHRLREFLDSMPDCTSASVDYLRLDLDGRPIVLGVYPKALCEAVQTPLSEGTFAASGDRLSLVLDSRLKGAYAVGDTLTARCSWSLNDGKTWQSDSFDVPAVVSGFLNADNDHISTLGGSNAQTLKGFTAKAEGSDALIALAMETPLLRDKPYTGDTSSILLLPAAGADIDDCLTDWRARIAEWNLGQIDDYRDLYRSDLWETSVLANVDLYLLTLWLAMLAMVCLIGYNLMHTEYAMKRLLAAGLLGMTKRRMFGMIVLGEYLPFWITNGLGLLIGVALARGSYPEFGYAEAPVILTALAITMLPHVIALGADATRIARLNLLQGWGERS